MYSVWERNWFFNYDTAIIGSGIVGLSTAAAILEENPSLKVLILERGLIPAGASTRNAGILSIGDFSEILEDIEKIGEEETKKLVSMKYEGFQKLRKRLGDEAIDYKHNGGYELITEDILPLLDKISYINEFLHPIFKEDIFSLANEKIEEFGFNKNIVKGLVMNKFEGQIDSGKTLFNLAQYVQKLGAKIITGANVTSYEKDANGHIRLIVDNPMKESDPYPFTSNNLVICTNAFTGALVKGLDFFPGRGQAIITKPIKNLKLKGSFSFDEGYYYFKDFYGRILLGGGRNVDPKGENTMEVKNTKNIMDKLESLLKELIIPGVDFEIDYQWAGIMCFGENSNFPIIDKIEDNVYLCIRMSGNGMAYASYVADEVKKMILKDAEKA